RLQHVLASLSSHQAPLAAGSSACFITHNKGDLCGPGEHPVVSPPGLIPWDDQNRNHGVVQQISSALVEESDTLTRGSKFHGAGTRWRGGGGGCSGRGGGS
ncbi:unnamed protein product, partial [Ectocarpus sp. 8 AP-2014]